jgi:hypothetical protein
VRGWLLRIAPSPGNFVSVAGKGVKFGVSRLDATDAGRRVSVDFAGVRAEAEAGFIKRGANVRRAGVPPRGYPENLE